MESIIKWQTGEPKESGVYLVTLPNGNVAFDRWLTGLPQLGLRDKSTSWMSNFTYVLAWCKLSDIEPYKEETV